jgi:hypothetical protein
MRLALLAVGDDGRSGQLEFANGLADSFVKDGF